MAGEGATRGGARGARGARGPRGRGRGGRAARGGRGASSAAATSSTNDDTPAAPEASMGDAPAAGPPSETVATSASASAAADPQPDAVPSPTAAATPPTAGRPTAAARGPRAGGRFLPRAIRRSQVARENIAAQESAKQEDKAALDARLRRAARGGRGGGRRARGGSNTGFDRIIRGGGGGFGSGIQSSGSRGSSGGFGGGFGRLYDAPSGGSGNSGPSSSRGAVKSEGGYYTFNNDSTRPTGPRLNTDRIVEVIAINDDEVKTKEGTPKLLPKGIFREEPKEPEQPQIATAAEVEAAERGETLVVSSSTSENGDVFYNEHDADMKDDGRRWPGAKDEDPVKVEGEEITEIDMLTRRRAEEKQQLKHEKKVAKYLDDEDRYDAEKLAKQRQLFGISSDDDSDDEDKETKETKAQRKPQIAEGSVYLFQFPPIMPPLHAVERTSAGRNHNPVKDEPSDDVVMLNAPAHDPEKPVDLTNDKIKEEDDENGASGSGVNREKHLESEDEPEGFVGKLVIRKSGKMQIDWGGMLFDCEMGIPRSFLRECVILEDDDEKKPDGYHGSAYGMGQVMGQFNSAPHWSEEQPWIVDPEDLPPWGVGAAPEGTEMEE